MVISYSKAIHGTASFADGPPARAVDIRPLDGVYLRALRHPLGLKLDVTGREIATPIHADQLIGLLLSQDFSFANPSSLIQTCCTPPALTQ